MVCGQLGFLGSTHNGNSYGAGPSFRTIWLDEVRCRGYENFLANCPHNGWGRHDCNHFEDVGVTCADGMLIYYLQLIFLSDTKI